ncbi:hypothetical protein C8J57DRAFT_555506 [Mycena rebaudengoi]|nr:hypothetical protein C8J57DRAFT_555506 [Mycena rebaudengoi]
MPLCLPPLSVPPTTTLLCDIISLLLFLLFTPSIFTVTGCLATPFRRTSRPRVAWTLNAGVGSQLEAVALFRQND